MFESINWLRAAALAAVICSGAHLLKAQDIGGIWRGTRSERNAITGGTFTLNFEFQFAGGSFRETASLGGAVILRLSGQYSLVPGSQPGDPTVTHILRVVPRNVETRPREEELRLLQMADLPNINGTQHYVTFFNVAPGGGMSLQNTEGGESWGLKRVLQ